MSIRDNSMPVLSQLLNQPEKNNMNKMNKVVMKAFITREEDAIAVFSVLSLILLTKRI